ncbi:hypothetical protein [Actinoplanes utahensis]|uniref:Uncharacterized protein n=1 Tax=Actinoplanes utahensis TaxID=1869 RepID=A0A0A6USZ2_ACTUT|nr:hypothetical protein [Actinoplanes utahensis]KHD79240.1 hypothetical protein MB27_01095 [Actinoplanes utahensis]GIF30338.1 hypothetical protein Aut01nite_33240 [Actinoplanes utahensis]
MTDELHLLDRLGTQLDPPDGPSAALRSRVMAEFVADGTLPHATTPLPRRGALASWMRQLRSPESTTRSWWLLPGLAAAVAAVLAGPFIVGLWPEGGPRTGPAPDSAPATFAPGATAARAVDTSVFGKAGSDRSDYMVFKSPETLAADKNVTAVFAGQVVGFTQGRALSGDGLEQKHVVMKVSVSKAIKGPDGDGGFAYVEMPQPICARNVPCSTVADFNKAVPTGTKVMVFGEDATEVAPAGGRFSNNQAGRPADARLIQPTPQGLLFESATAEGSTIVGAYEKVEDMPIGWHKDLPAGINGLATRLKAAQIDN